MAVTLPVVNGSSGTWGTILNAALTDIDGRLTTTISDTSGLQSRVSNLETSGGGKLTVATSSSRPSPAVGQVVLETDTGFLYYVASIGGNPTRVPFPGSYVAKLKRTSTQNFGNNSAGALQYSIADVDRLGGFSTGTPSRYTAQVAGTYEFTGAISYSVSATGYRSASWYYQGGAFNGGGAVVPGTSGETTVVVARPAIIRMSAGEYVELYGLQNSGATLTTDTTTAYQPGMQVKYLGYNV